MTAASGTIGSVIYTTGGTTTVDEIAEWALDISHGPVDSTAFGDNWADYVPSVRNATGSFSGNFDPDDAGQSSLVNAMLGGSALGLKLYLGSALNFDVQTAYLTELAPAVSVDGEVETGFSFQAINVRLGDLFHLYNGTADTWNIGDGTLMEALR